MIYAPFPSVDVTDRQHLNDGYLYGVPKFCQQQFKSNSNCIQHYRSIEEVGKFYNCPYGFCSYRQSINGKDTILTSLNIERISNKKSIQKRVTATDWLPRIPYARFQQTILSLSVPMSTETIHAEIKEKEKKLENTQNLIDDTFHEIRKINNQLKFNSEYLTEQMPHIGLKDRMLEDTIKSIYANTDLLSKRLNAYDYLVHPESSKNDLEIDIPVYKKFEKVYKCLYTLRHNNGVNVKLEGMSVACVKNKDILELAFYIIVENAIKYSPRGENVKIVFGETIDKLVVKVINWGLKVSESEVNLLTNRGYRGDLVRKKAETMGSGIGLYLFRQICEANNVQYKIKIGSDIKSFNGWVYRPFVVEITFKQIYFR